MNILEINQRIQQRPPFQMIDKVLEIKPLEYGKGVKNVCINEPFFVGHFPGFPIMPGVLITEAAAQLCSLVMSFRELSPNQVPVLLKIDSMKFIKPAVPGDTLIIEVTKTQDAGNVIKFEVIISDEGVKMASGTLAFTIIDKNSVYVD